MTLSDLFSLFILGLPFLFILLGMVGLKWSALKAGALALLVTLVSVPWFLELNATNLLTHILPGSLLEAVITSLSILWIILGALCIYYAQENVGAIQEIQQQLAKLHADPRVAALFIAWFFSLFMEGAAGFGTSAALTAPFLVAAGYRPVLAVVLALWGHSLGVAFGAVGTPVLVQALLVPETELQLGRAVLPFLLPTTFVMAVGLAWACMRYGQNTQAISFRTMYFQAGGFGVLAAFSFLLPAAGIAWLLGPELPTLLGALIGAGVFTLFTSSGRHKALVANNHLVANDNDTPARGSFVRAIAPYAILILLVLVTRLIPEVKSSLQVLQWQVNWRGYQGAIQYLYHPGTLLFISFVLGGLIQGQSWKTLFIAFKQAGKRVSLVLAALFVMLLLSRLLVHTGAIAQLGQLVATIVGNGWPFWAPWFGVLGTFITGSATSSNILFSEFQRSAAMASNQQALLSLGSQTFGAAVGNMVCPHNIIAAGATVNIRGEEGKVMTFTLPMAILLISIAGVVALLI